MLGVKGKMEVITVAILMASSALDAVLLSTRRNSPRFFQRKPLNVPESESLTGNYRLQMFEADEERQQIFAAISGSTWTPNIWHLLITSTC